MTRKQPFTFEEFRAIYSKVPRLCVELVIHTDKGFLMILRKKHGWEGQWHIPGGTVFYKEPIEATVKRVGVEELGVDVTINSFYSYMEYPNEEKERGFGYSVTLVFMCSLPSTVTLTNQEEQIEFFLIPPDNSIVEHKRLLEKILKEKSLV